MGLNYEADRVSSAKKSVKSWNKKALDSAGKFPNCKGLFPDCPDVPSKDNKMCRSCPKVDE